MNLLEILNSIWTYVQELPQHIIDFFSSFGDFFGIVQNFLNFVKEVMFDGTNLIGGGAFVFNALLHFLVAGVVFIIVDVLRDVL